MPLPNPFCAGLKVNAKGYNKHLEKILLSNTESIMKRNDWIFLQDSAPSHKSNLVQDFLTEKLHKRFVKHTEWAPTSLDCNFLDYHFWDEKKIKVYGNKFSEAFANEQDLKKNDRKALAWSIKRS